MRDKVDQLTTDVRQSIIDEVSQKILDSTTVIVDNEENVLTPDEARVKHARVPLVEFVLRSGARAEEFQILKFQEISDLVESQNASILKQFQHHTTRLDMQVQEVS